MTFETIIRINAYRYIYMYKITLLLKCMEIIISENLLYRCRCKLLYTTR